MTATHAATLSSCFEIRFDSLFNDERGLAFPCNQDGQVDIDTLSDPPQLIVGSIDGLTVVRVLKTDEIARNDVHLGDYIEAAGNKVNEQLFDADQISVSERYAAASTENDNKKKKK